VSLEMGIDLDPQPLELKIRHTYECDDDIEFDEESYTYHGIISSLGVDIVAAASGGDFQGDSMLIVKLSDRYGILTYGWGSCSGCDRLLACNGYEDMVNLRRELMLSIKWGTKEEVIEYLRTKDWEVTHFDADLICNFLSAVDEYFELGLAAPYRKGLD